MSSARSAGVPVADAEDRLDGLAQGLLLRPAGEGFGDGIEEGDAAGGIGGQHGVADAAEGDVEPLALVAQLGGARGDDVLQVHDAGSATRPEPGGGRRSPA